MKLIKVISMLISITLLITILFDFACFPESYLPTWKYQLQQDIQSGKAEAIEYYQETYLANGRELFK